MEQAFQSFAQALSKASSVLITAHVSPDGDGIGSILALKHSLPSAFANIKAVDCVVTGKVPNTLAFLPGWTEIINLDQQPAPTSSYDIAISVDSGDLGRLGKAQSLFEQAPVRVNIDHHITNAHFGSINLIETTAASTGQVIALFLDAIQAPYIPEVATCIYTTLLADTGGFKYSNTTTAVFDLAARLVQAGADPELCYKKLLDESTRAQVLLHADVLANAQFNSAATVGWGLVSRAQLEKHQALEEYVDGLVESIRKIDSVQVAALFKETPDGITKVSTRSDNHAINVAKIVGQFGGGGHSMAAGCTIEKSPAEAAKALIPLLEAAVKNASK